MNWIKTHYDRVVLAIVSALLLGSSLFLANEAIQSRSIFVNLTTQVKQSDKIPGVPVGELTQAQNALENPTLWTFKKGNGSYEKKQPFHPLREHSPHHQKMALLR